jgi:hypothetical protein
VRPQLKRRRALLVLGKIDQLLTWEAHRDNERDSKFVEQVCRIVVAEQSRQRLFEAAAEKHGGVASQSFNPAMGSSEPTPSGG